MKRVLIVVPWCRHGGVLTSLIALLNSSFVERYQVSIFIMAVGKKEINSVIAKYSIGSDNLLSKIYCSVANARGVNKLILICYKLIFRIPLIGKHFIKWIEYRSMRMIEKYNYDCVISFQENTSLQFVSKLRNSNKIAWIHCDYSRIFSNESDEMEIFLKYAKIVTVSNYTKNIFCQLLPQLSNRVYTIYNIMDVDSILIKAESPIEDKNFINECFTIISVGRIAEVKQFECIPVIASALLSKGLSFKWYILGGIAEAKAFKKLKRAITDNNMDDYVIYLGHKANPYPYFKAADLLVSTSNSEACPMIFNEAKILHLPIISNNFGSADEFINKGEDGDICKIEDMDTVIGDIINARIDFCPSVQDMFCNSRIQKEIDRILN